MLNKNVSEIVEAFKGKELTGLTGLITEELLYKFMYGNENIYQIVLSDKLSNDEKVKLINCELVKVKMFKH